ncbi:MAG: AzlD domain-containing protein [Oscillospiraceae bacterium]|nr:AzlD domain-containing protein [Oscillospiraceae bacterium]
MKFFVYLIATAGTTYLVRMLPLVLMKGKITNRFLLSFLHYIPYAVLSVMTIPAIFSATGDLRTAAAGFVVAMVLSWKGKSLLTVAAAACAAVLAAELML